MFVPCVHTLRKSLAMPLCFYVPLIKEDASIIYYHTHNTNLKPLICKVAKQDHFEVTKWYSCDTIYCAVECNSNIYACGQN